MLCTERALKRHPESHEVRCVENACDRHKRELPGSFNTAQSHLGDAGKRQEKQSFRQASHRLSMLTRGMLYSCAALSLCLLIRSATMALTNEFKKMSSFQEVAESNIEAVKGPGFLDNLKKGGLVGAVDYSTGANAVLVDACEVSSRV